MFCSSLSILSLLSQLCFLIGTASQVNDVAHGPLVYVYNWNQSTLTYGLEIWYERNVLFIKYMIPFMYNNHFMNIFPQNSTMHGD